MDLQRLIRNPELMNRETLYELRSLLALYPYFQTARVMLLQNLYLLHDPAYDEELRRAAIYIRDRKTIFNLLEAAHYRWSHVGVAQDDEARRAMTGNAQTSRTVTLIDRFLESIPEEQRSEERKRRPTPADATIDYVSYLLQTESETPTNDTETAEMKGQGLIDDFISTENGNFNLKEIPEYVPAADDEDDKVEGLDTNDGYFTETLARIYIKQGRYSKALEIIKRLNLNYPKKSIYFADQIRFLEKLIINTNNK